MGTREMRSFQQCSVSFDARFKIALLSGGKRGSDPITCHFSIVVSLSVRFGFLYDKPTFSLAGSRAGFKTCAYKKCGLSVTYIFV